MRLHHFILLATFSAIANAQTGKSADLGKAVQTITPIFHQLVAFNLPTTFQIGSPDQANLKFYLHEIPLKGESVERWTQLITLNGFHGAVQSGNTVGRTITKTAENFQTSCPASFAGLDLGASTISGCPAYLFIASCGNVADLGGQAGAMHSEMALLVGMEGDQDIYTLQWAERGPASSTPMVLDEAKWKSRFQQLNPIHICARIEGEPAPYPSCTGK